MSYDDLDLKSTLEQGIRKLFGNAVIVRLMDDGKFIVSLSLEDETKRSILTECSQRCVDVVNEMGRGQ